MTAGIEGALGDWESGPDALRRFRRRLDGSGSVALDAAERALRAELGRRLGPNYALAKLYAEYLASETWATEIVHRELHPRTLPAAIAPLIDAAFLHASRSALDAAR